MIRREILKNISLLTDELIKENNLYGYTIDFNYKMKIGDGACDNYYYNNKQIHIGIKELGRIFDKDISDELVFSLFKTIFHEIHHAKQQYEYFNKKDIIKGDEFKTQMFLNHLACIGAYYGYYSSLSNLSHYFNNIREIDAEYNALINVTSYLSHMIGEDKTNILLLNYINSKQEQIYYFSIDKPIQSSLELSDLFKKAINKTLHKKNMYIPEYINKDESIKYMQSINNDFILQVNDYPASVEQDKVLAGAYIKYIEQEYTYFYKRFLLV